MGRENKQRRTVSLFVYVNLHLDSAWRLFIEVLMFTCGERSLLLCTHERQFMICCFCNYLAYIRETSLICSFASVPLPRNALLRIPLWEKKSRCSDFRFRGRNLRTRRSKFHLLCTSPCVPSLLHNQSLLHHSGLSALTFQEHVTCHAIVTPRAGNNNKRRRGCCRVPCPRGEEPLSHTLHQR